MTRSYFVDYVTDWDELLELCRDYDCDICDDIIDDDQLDDYVDADIENTRRGWRDIRDYLNDIPTGYDHYRCDGEFDYVALDNDGDFEDYKSRIFDWMDENDLWEPEEDEEYDEEDEESYDDVVSPSEPEEPAVEEEDFSVNDLMSMCGAELVTIYQVMQRREKTKDMELVLPF